MRLLYVGPSYGGQILHEAKKYGMEMVLIEHPDRIRPGYAELVDECHLLNFKDEDALTEMVQRIQNRRPVDAMISLGEGGVLQAARVAERLGIPTTNPSRAVELAYDKFKMRQALDAAGVPNIRHALCRTADDAVAFLAETGKAIILKPHNGFGSRSIHRVEQAVEAREAFAKIREGNPQSEVLAEVYLSGREISVEAFSCGGEHHVIVCTDKTTTGYPRFIELGHVVPAVLTPEELKAAEQLCKQTLDVIGMQNGPSHTEMMLTADGAYVIETHTRPGGDEIPNLIRMAFGIDMFQAMFELLDGKTPNLTATKDEAAAIRYLTPQPGRITCIEHPQALTELSWVREVVVDVQVGDEVPELAISFDRAGWVIASGSTPEEAESRARQLSEAMVIETEGVERAAT